MFRGWLIKIKKDEIGFDEVNFSSSFLDLVKNIKKEEVVLRKKLEYTFLLKLINKYLDANIRELNFKYGKYGKPSLDFIEIGISNSADLLFVAICDSPVGIDIEKISPDKKINSTLEEKLLKRSANKTREEFFKCWTKYESFFKREGSFISLEKIKNTKLNGYFYQDIVRDNECAYSLSVSLRKHDGDFILEFLKNRN